MFNLFPKNKVIILLILVVIFGIFLRITNLNQKPYWYDEAYTLLRSSGYSALEANENLSNGQVISVEDGLRYQHPSSQDKGAMGTILGLASEEPQHPPLYFLLTRIWAQLFGNSKSSMRSLPVICSILAFPAIYWLCLELFSSPLVAWLAMALVAVSPIHLRYSQMARQYSLWTTLILLSCAAILRAIRQPTKLNWAVYCLIISIGIYCHLLMGLVVIAHGIYILAIEGFRLTKIVIGYLVSSLVAIIVAFPWLWIVWQNRNVVTYRTEWTSHKLPFSVLVQIWSIVLDRLFVAWHFNDNFKFIYLTIPVIFLVVYGFYFFRRYTSKRIWLFILILMATIFLPLLIPDLIFGGERSINERYFLICYVCIDLIIAYLLASKLTQQLQNYFWRFITIFILSIGILSCTLAVFSPTWWGWSEFDVKIAQITNSVDKPLIISDLSFDEMASFFSEVKPDTKFIILPNTNLFHIPDKFSNVFLYNPSKRLLSVVRQRNFEPKLVYSFRDSMTKFVFSFYQLSPSKL